MQPQRIYAVPSEGSFVFAGNKVRSESGNPAMAVSRTSSVSSLLPLRLAGTNSITPSKKALTSMIRRISAVLQSPRMLLHASQFVRRDPRPDRGAQNQGPLVSGGALLLPDCGQSSAVKRKSYSRILERALGGARSAERGLTEFVLQEPGHLVREAQWNIRHSNGGHKATQSPAHRLFGPAPEPSDLHHRGDRQPI